MKRKLLTGVLTASIGMLLTGCAGSLTDVKVDKVQLCDKGRCATLGSDMDSDQFLSRVYAFLSSRINQDAQLAEAEPQSRTPSGEGITYFTQGGPLPFYTRTSSLKFTDVSFLDREKKEIRFKLRPWNHFLGIPVLCAEGEGTLTVISPKEVLVEATNFCSWMVVGTIGWQMKLKLDRIDLDNAQIAGYYSIGHAGPASGGKGSGYQVARFVGPATPTADTATTGPQPGTVPTLVATAQQASPGAALDRANLAYTVTFSDGNKDGVLDAGERISLQVEVTNRGTAPARETTVQLGGTPFVTDLLGTTRSLGTLGPQEKRSVLFEAALPPRLPLDAAELRIEVREAGTVAAETRTVRLAARSSDRVETVQVISQPPQLHFTLELQDQNNNRILEGGEEIALLAEVANRGTGPAENVQLRLSGTRSLVALFGEKQPVGDLPAGSRKRVEMRGVLPVNVSSESAQLKVELSEGRGFAPSESRVLRVATKGHETQEVVEVISDLNVDDIPAKVRSFVRKDDVAVVIGIGSYRESVIPAVKYARRDAEVVAKYLEHLSGIPRENIALLTDANATKSDIEAYLEDWLPRRVTPASRVYFYYAGHGAPEPEGKGAFLVPYEGHPDFTSKLVPLGRLYQTLNRLKAREVVVLLDSCFSGAKGRSVMQSGIRPLVLTSERQLAVEGKAVVVASASGSEVTSDFEPARHGLFTYFLLKGLRGEADNNGDTMVTIGELFGFVSSHVSQTASRELNRTQTPVLLPGQAAQDLEGMAISRTR